MLEELGYGLDLGQCAATGTREDLIYVSPKSGRAVSREAGADYADRMLVLPSFLTPGRSDGVTPLDAVDGLALTEHFLQTRVWGPRELVQPDVRTRLVGYVRRMASEWKATQEPA